MSTNYEPSAEAVEAEALEVSARYKAAVGFGVEFASSHSNWQDFCRHEARVVLRRQHERESRLLAGIVRAQEWLSVGSMDTAQHELSETRVWYNKLDAPKVPTLLEAAKAMVAPLGVTREHQLVSVALYDALKAAVERAEKSG